MPPTGPRDRARRLYPLPLGPLTAKATQSGELGDPTRPDADAGNAYCEISVYPSTYTTPLHLFTTTYIVHRAGITMETLRRWNHDILALIRRNQRTFNICQVGFYGTTLSCMVLATVRPELVDWMTEATNKDLDKYAFTRLAVKLYEEGNLAGAAGITFAINTLAGAFGTMTLPGVLVPYYGVALGVYRAGAWGLLFPPTGKATTWPHLITLVLEGQAYVLAGFGSWLLSNAVLEEVKDWWAARKRGEAEPLVEQEQGVRGEKLWKACKDNAKLYIPIVGILAVSAVWEAYEVIHMGIDKVKP